MYAEIQPLSLAKLDPLFENRIRFLKTGNPLFKNRIRFLKTGSAFWKPDPLFKNEPQRLNARKPFSQYHIR